MLPKNPFLQLTIPRASRALARLESEIWGTPVPVACAFAAGGPQHCSFEAATRLKFRDIRTPFCWGKLFDQGWFRLRFPQKTGAPSAFLRWVDQGEGTLYVEGTPYYGFDVAHRHCRLPQGVKEVFVEGLCLQSAIWHHDAKGLDPRGSLLGEACLVSRNEEAWKTYYDFKSLYDLAIEEGKANSPSDHPKTYGIGFRPPLDVVSPDYRMLLRALDDAVNSLDQGGLAAAAKSLAASYQKLSQSEKLLRAILTGHAHIDLVWLWPERAAEFKAAHTFATMNRLMETYPEFRFAYSQPASYEAVAAKSPELMKAVRRRLETGQWEALGAAYVESDTLMACGEALARSFLVGQQALEDLQGAPSPILWLPDVFGYSGCLPQILAQTGVRYFFTTKLTWSNINRFPYSSFVWRGTDGSEVLVHVTQENGYNQAVSPEELRRGARAYRQADLHAEFLCPTGYGDGGGGPTEEMCERARRYDRLLAMPGVTWDRVDRFFERLDAVRPDLPVYQGELYLEYHRGVLTSHSPLKAAFRACERSLQALEAAHAVAGLGQVPENFWKRLIFAQFHDYIPGSSVWEVYEEGVPELTGIAAESLSMARSLLGDTATGKQCAFNPLPIEQLLLCGAKNRKAFCKLPPLSVVPLEELEAVQTSTSVTATPDALSREGVEARFDKCGRISSLTFGGHQVALAAPLAQLAVYPDFPHEFEAWDIDRQTLSLGKAIVTPATKVTASASGLEGWVEFSHSVGKSSLLRVRYILDAVRDVLRVEFDVEWHEAHALLKVHFPTLYCGRYARFGAPFGSVLRGQHPGHLTDEAMFESAGSRWACVADDSEREGLALVTESKYGFSCRSGNLGLSLLRSPAVTGQDPGHARVVPEALRRGPRRAGFTDQGAHHIRLAICPFSSTLPRAANPAALADALYTPAVTVRAEAVHSGFLGLEGGDSLLPSWAKPADDGNGWMLRLHETLGQRGTAKLLLKPGFTASLSDLAERKLSNKRFETVAFDPYQVITIRISRKSA